MSLKAYHRLLLLLTLSTVLTILGREGVISSVETQDGYCSVREFFVWAGIMVVVHTRFVTENQRCEAFVKLTDGLCLEGREGGQEMRRKAEITNYENKVTVKSSVYRQDMVHIHYFLQNLPVPVRNKFKGSTLPIGRTKFIHLWKPNPSDDLVMRPHRIVVRYLLKSSQLSGSSMETEDFVASQGTEMVKPATSPDSVRLRAR